MVPAQPCMDAAPGGLLKSIHCKLQGGIAGLDSSSQLSGTVQQVATWVMPGRSVMSTHAGQGNGTGQHFTLLELTCGLRTANVGQDATPIDLHMAMSPSLTTGCVMP